jgi:hypothetical protein
MRRAAAFALGEYDAATASEALVARAGRAGAGDALHRPIARAVPPPVAVLLRPTPPPRRSAEPTPGVAEPLRRLAESVARVEREAPPGDAAIVDAGVAAHRSTAPPALDAPRVQRLPSAPGGGLRGLAALAESLRPSPAPSAPLPARAESALPAIDESELAARMYELLRRDAERHGIDVTGVAP